MSPALNRSALNRSALNRSALRGFAVRRSALTRCGVIVATLAAACAVTATSAARAGVAPDSSLVSAAVPYPTGALIAAASDTDTMWVGGFAQPSSDVMSPVVLRRTSPGGRWAELALPGPSTGMAPQNMVLGLATVPGAPRTVWAVGDDEQLPSPRTCSVAGNTAGPLLADRWTGTAWRRTSVPVSANTFNASLTAVDARNATDVWAVGASTVVDSVNPVQIGTQTLCGLNRHSESLVEHWTGTAWRRVSSPGASTFIPMSVLVDGDAVWTAGYDGTTPLVYERVHGIWTTSNLPLGGAQGQLNALTRAADGTLWAAGATTSSDGTSHALVLHRTAGRWHVVAMPSWAGPAWSIALTPAGAVLTGSLGADPTQSYVVRRGGAGWIRVPMPRLSGQIATAGATYSSGLGLAVVGNRMATATAEAPNPLLMLLRRTL